MHDSKCPVIIGQKSAQMGYSETAINRAFYYIDILGESVLYVLPTERPDAVDFSASRFDPALEMSPHLQNLFSDTKNLGLKRAGSACLYVRSSRSRSQLKSIPAGNLVFDELDEMSEESRTLAQERASGQENKTEFDLSTPTAPGYGINALFMDSTQSHYFFKCPHCSRRIKLEHENLVITAETHFDKNIVNSYYKCLACGHKLDHRQKLDWYESAEWVAAMNDTIVEGYRVNQLYSLTIQPFELARLYLLGTQRPSKMQEYYNSKLGLPKLMEGAQLDLPTVEQNKGNYESPQYVSPDRYITMGVDVGTLLNVEITDWAMPPSIQAKEIHARAVPSVVKALTVKNFEDLDGLMAQYNVRYCVIDKDPDRRKALEFAKRFPGKVKLCHYSEHVLSDELIISNVFVSVHRTSWLDLVLARFRLKAIHLPNNISLEYMEQMCAPMRILKEDQNGNPISRYVNSKADHYAHARNYSEVAFGLSIGLGTVKDMTDPV